MPGAMVQIASNKIFYIWESSNGIRNERSEYLVFHKGKNGKSDLQDEDFKKKYGVHIKDFIKMRLKEKPDLVKEIQTTNDQNVRIQPVNVDMTDKEVNIWSNYVLDALRLNQ